ncbi:hypothetical protein HOY34_11210 [Xinfangfangia sp. D13-10-4-6]|uniref:hypothetical protein n=1 Tax=Pseudogemmobacter hezensis TaxID=2737662 RepID=UPI001556F72F|nr:hypothetical protein [Pseudogemmobacter hezensis]NPD15771.1 hypothetical protein [Pseudogemmobacter hezensis]
MQRRDLLIASGAALTASLGTQAVKAACVLNFEETPVQQAYLAWKRSLDGWTADMERDSSDENGDRWCMATFKLADDILDIPSEGPMDLIWKIMAYSYHGQHEIGDGARGEEIWAEARALVGVSE